jgi:hypothetical protein
MKYLKILAVFGAFVLVGAGSATLLDVYGVVSGTADVEAAVDFSGDINTGDDQITLEKNTGQKITEELNLEVYNATSGSSEESVVESEGDIVIEADTGQKTLDVNLSGVEQVGLELDDTVLEVEEVQ